jgi:hypothetical protein
LEGGNEIEEGKFPYSAAGEGREGNKGRVFPLFLYFVLLRGLQPVYKGKRRALSVLSTPPLWK